MHRFHVSMLDAFSVQEILGQAEYVMAIDQTTGHCHSLYGDNVLGPGRGPGSGPREIKKIEIDLDNEGDLPRAQLAVDKAKGLLATRATQICV